METEDLWGFSLLVHVNELIRCRAATPAAAAAVHFAPLQKLFFFKTVRSESALRKQLKTAIASLCFALYACVCDEMPNTETTNMAKCFEYGPLLLAVASFMVRTPWISTEYFLQDHLGTPRRGGYLVGIHPTASKIPSPLLLLLAVPFWMASNVR